MDHLYCVLDQFGFPTQVMVTMLPHESAIPGPDVQDMADVERNGYWFDGTDWYSVGAKPSEWHVIDRLNKAWIGNYEGLREWVKQRVHAIRTEHGYQPIEYNGSMFDADWIAIGNIQAWQVQIAAGLILPEGFVWRDFNNVDHPADAAFINGLGAAVTLRGTTLYQIAWSHKAAIDALPDDLDAINSYDPTTGWG